MCLGIPGRVVAIVDPERAIARADVGGIRRNVSTALLRGDDAGVAVGDWILIHVGFALAKIDAAEAAASTRWLEGAADAGDELEAFRGSGDA